MNPPAFEVATMAERPELARNADDLIDTVWPALVIGIYERAAWACWERLWADFPAYQFVLLEPGTDTVMVVGNSIPLAWTGDPADLPDTGWDWAITQGCADLDDGRPPVTLCAMSVSVLAPYQGRGLSSAAVRAMKQIGAAHGLRDLIAPVRPSLKDRYPLIPIEEYLTWQRPDGLPFDPWLRVHARLGAEIVRACPRSMVVTGSVADFERVSGTALPGSGRHIIPHALTPVLVHRDADRAVYVEPNVWMRHTLP